MEDKILELINSITGEKYVNDLSVTKTEPNSGLYTYLIKIYLCEKPLSISLQATTDDGMLYELKRVLQRKSLNSIKYYKIEHARRPFNF